MCLRLKDVTDCPQIVLKQAILMSVFSIKVAKVVHISPIDFYFLVLDLIIFVSFFFVATEG